jgi:hypothetical protein
MTARERLDERPAAQRASAGQLQVKPVTLALQGGGAHGAFAWGVLDRLLEDGRIDFEGISATSAGAMNAVVLAYGLMQGGPAGARQALHGFWRDIAASAALYSPFRQLPGVGNLYGHRLDHSPFYLMTVADGEMKRMLIHSIRADETMAGLGVSSKLNADWRFLCTLRDRGRAQAGHWLAETYDALGERSSVDIRAEFL